MKAKFRFQLGLFISLMVAGVLLTAAVAYNLYHNNGEFNAGLSVAMRQKAAAFEIENAIQLLAHNEATDREKAIQKLSGLLSNWEIVQRGLVDGNEVYRISNDKSPDLISKIEATSQHFLNAHKSTKKLITANDFSDNNEIQTIYSELESFAEGMNDVAGQYNKESDQFLFSNLILLLIIAGALGVVLWIGFRILLLPLLRKAEESDTVKGMVAGEIESVRASRTEFLTNMGHELIAPINGMLGMAEILSKTPLTEEQRGYVKSMKNSGSNILNIVTDILDHNSLESGDIEVIKEAFVLNDCIDQAVDLVKPLVGDKQVELICDVDPSLPFSVIQDERRIRQSLVNLMAYAIKVSEQGEVMLKVELLNREGDFIQIKASIKDSGKGLSATEQRRVFLSAAEESNDNHPISLKIVKQLVEKMGGRIWVDNSTASGATISFTIVAEASGAIEMTKVSKLSGKKVLVVDTNKTALKITVKQLSTWGMQATPFNSVELVMDMIDNLTRFDLCIIDAATQEMGGRSLAEKIRSRYAEADLPMIITTTNTHLAVDRRGDLFTAILTKPIKQAKLLETILSVLHLDNNTETIGVYEGAFGKKHLRILIAQDNDLMRAVTEKNLSILGHKCTAVRSGKEVIDVGVKGKYDLLIVDSKLDEITGIDAVKHLRRIVNEDDMPLVFGLIDEGGISKREMKQAGADEVLSQRIAAEEIQQKIEEWFAISS